VTRETYFYQDFEISGNTRDWYSVTCCNSRIECIETFPTLLAAKLFIKTLAVHTPNTQVTL